MRASVEFSGARVLVDESLGFAGVQALEFRAIDRAQRSSQRVDDFARGVGAGCAGQAIAGMRAGAAEEEAADRSLVARPVEHGAHGEELVERELAVEDVPAGETV